MRILLIILTLTLAGAPVFAASLTPSSATATEKPPKNKGLHKEKKGTMGFIAALVFGPVGYLGVRLFSHNEMVRYKAKRGIVVWTGIATAGAAVWLSAITGSSISYFDLWTALGLN